MGETGGRSDKSPITDETVCLEDGDVLGVFSDGVTEATNEEGEEFGDGGLEACIDDHRNLEPSDLLAHILGAVSRFSGNMTPTDDITALVLRRATPQS